MVSKTKDIKSKYIFSSQAYDFIFVGVFMWLGFGSFSVLKVQIYHNKILLNDNCYWSSK